MTDFGEIGRRILSAGGIVALDARAVQASVAVMEQAGPLTWPGPPRAETGPWRAAGPYGRAARRLRRRGRRERRRPGGLVSPPARGRPGGRVCRAAGRVQAAFAADGVLDRDFTLPEIDPAATFPAGLAISFHFIDYVVHGWDVARTLGLDYQLEPRTCSAWPWPWPRPSPTTTGPGGAPVPRSPRGSARLPGPAARPGHGAARPPARLVGRPRAAA